jgi:hypothetical protein
MDAAVPWFFFNIHDADQTFYDPEGTELAALDVARHEALMDARWILGEELRTGRVTLERQFEITDEAGQVLATVHFRDVASQLLDGMANTPSRDHSCDSGAGAAEG